MAVSSLTPPMENQEEITRPLRRWPAIPLDATEEVTRKVPQSPLQALRPTRPSQGSRARGSSCSAPPDDPRCPLAQELSGNTHLFAARPREHLRAGSAVRAPKGLLVIGGLVIAGVIANVVVWGPSIRHHWQPSFAPAHGAFTPPYTQRSRAVAMVAPQIAPLPDCVHDEDEKLTAELQPSWPRPVGPRTAVIRKPAVTGARVQRPSRQVTVRRTWRAPALSIDEADPYRR
jgi:hypothetical protein